MKAVISVTGKDNVGIIASVSTYCAEKGANIIDIDDHLLGHKVNSDRIDTFHLSHCFLDFSCAYRTVNFYF